MGSHIWASISVGMSFFLALLWCVLLFGPFSWSRTNGNVLYFEASLFYVTVHKGGATRAAEFLTGSFISSQISSVLDVLLEKVMGMEDAKTHFCQLPLQALGYCDQIGNVVMATYAMLFFGCCTAVMLAVGGILTTYYTNEHATETGRSWIRICLSIAPVLAILGILCYASGTYKFGAERLEEWTLPWTSTYFMAILLAFLSFLPIFIVAVFGKDLSAKKLYENDMLIASGQGPTQGSGGPPWHPGYGAGSGAPGGAVHLGGPYGGAPPAQQMVYSVQGGYGSAPPPRPHPVGGFAAPQGNFGPPSRPGFGPAF